MGKVGCSFLKSLEIRIQQLLRIQLFITGQGRVEETKAASALRPPRLGCGPEQVRPCNFTSGVERLSSAFCMGQRSEYLELCLLVSVHSALRVWPAQPTGLIRRFSLCPLGMTAPISCPGY